MLTKQDIEDYSEVSEQPSRYSEEFLQKQQSEKQLKYYLAPSFAEWTSDYVRDNLYKLKLK